MAKDLAAWSRIELVARFFGRAVNIHRTALTHNALVESRIKMMLGGILPMTAACNISEIKATRLSAVAWSAGFSGPVIGEQWELGYHLD